MAGSGAASAPSSASMSCTSMSPMPMPVPMPATPRCAWLAACSGCCCCAVLSAAAAPLSCLTNPGPRAADVATGAATPLPALSFAVRTPSPLAVSSLVRCAALPSLSASTCCASNGMSTASSASGTPGLSSSLEATSMPLEAMRRASSRRRCCSCSSSRFGRRRSPPARCGAPGCAQGCKCASHVCTRRSVCAVCQCMAVELASTQGDCNETAWPALIEVIITQRRRCRLQRITAKPVNGSARRTCSIAASRLAAPLARAATAASTRLPLLCSACQLHAAQLVGPCWLPAAAAICRAAQVALRGVVSFVRGAEETAIVVCELLFDDCMWPVVWWQSVVCLRVRHAAVPRLPGTDSVLAAALLALPGGGLVAASGVSRRLPAALLAGARCRFWRWVGHGRQLCCTRRRRRGRRGGAGLRG